MKLLLIILLLQYKEESLQVYFSNIDLILSLINDFGKRYQIKTEDLINVKISDYFNLNNILLWIIYLNTSIENLKLLK